jgi:hypothetical protein
MLRTLSLLSILILASLSVSLGQKSGAAGDGSTSSQLSIFTGTTTVTLSSDFAEALGTLQISPSSAFPGRLVRNRAIFPITTGTLDAATLRGEISHAGGLILQRGSTLVRLESFIIDTTGAGGIVLTGLVSANGTVVGRIPLFDLTLPATFRGDPTLIRLSGVSVTLRPEAAGALNAVFETTAFTAGFDIGTASVTATAFGI